MPDQPGIHLVHSSQVSANPQPLDPADIALAVLETVRQCHQALEDVVEYHEYIQRQMELVAKQLQAAKRMGSRSAEHFLRNPRIR